MAKKGANNNNQLVYYILFFVLGAIFAAGILAVNDGISGRAIEASVAEFDPQQVIAAYAEFKQAVGEQESPEAAAIAANHQIQETLPTLRSDFSREVYLGLVEEHLEEILIELSAGEHDGAALSAGEHDGAALSAGEHDGAALSAGEHDGAAL